MKGIPKWRAAVFCCALCLAFSMQGVAYAQSTQEMLQQNQGYQTDFSAPEQEASSSSVSDEDQIALPNTGSTSLDDSATTEGESSGSNMSSESDVDTGSTAQDDTDSTESGEGDADTGSTAQDDTNSPESGEGDVDTGSTAQDDTDSTESGEGDVDTGSTADDNADSAESGETDADTGSTADDDADSTESGETDADTGSTAEDGSSSTERDESDADTGSTAQDDAGSNIGAPGNSDVGSTTESGSNSGTTGDDNSDASEEVSTEDSEKNDIPDKTDGIEVPKNEVLQNEPLTAEVKIANGWYTAPDGKRYYYENGSPKKGWLVTGGERYWLDPKTGELFTNGLFYSDTGAGYAQPNGVVVRGFYNDANGSTYYANNDGVLSKGWYVGMYGNDLQRFYFDTTTYAAKKGLFQVGGGAYYGTTQGYVLRGYSNADGNTYIANNEGVLSKGWYVGMYGNNLERFYLDTTTYAAKKGLFSVGGSAYYGLPEGYVLRGITNVGNDTYVANNDGVLSKGWYIGMYGNNLERFYLDSTTYKAKKGLFKVGTSAYYGTSKGYVVRGLTTADGNTYAANNDGVLSKGWYVGMYGKELQRFYFDPSTYAATKGLFKVSGSAYYGGPQGYVVRGLTTANGNTYAANNEGVLSKGWYVGMYGNELQRFYFDPTTYAAKKGLFKVSGSAYYGGPQGYVVRGLTTANGNTYAANNDGVLSKGWYVGMYGNELQRFYFDPTTYAAKKGLFKMGTSAYYGGPQGYVLRGFSTADGNTYVANNDGVLSKGWYVGMYGNELQRFYLDTTTYAAKKGLFKVGTSAYYGTPQGYVLRGLTTLNGNTYYASNEGILYQGFWVTNQVAGGSLERYYFSPSDYTMMKGEWFNVAGSDYYAQTSGACARGWVTIGGLQYEFNNDGVYLGNIKNPAGILGIDVSKHQGPIDWAKVRASGIQFAIIRALGWNSSLKYYEVDPYFNANMQGAISTGIPVGAYLYSYAFSEAEMLEEINFILPTLNQWKNSFTYPVYIDYEDNLIWQNTQSNDQRTNILRTGMDALAQNGFLPGFYTYYNAAKTYINTQQLIDEGYDFWVAHFSTDSNPWQGAGIWQYTSSGTVSGINGNVDLNYAYIDYPALSKTVTVYDVNTGKNVQGKIKDLVPQMVQNEVGGGLGLTGTDKASLFKAQTLAARSYLQFHTSRGLVPTVGLRAPSAEVLSSSSQVMRLGIYYNNSVINAAYGSCAGAYTNSAQNMGWGDYPYLTSVESPYDKTFAPGFYPKTSTISTQTMKNNVIKMVGQAQFDLYANDMSKWITAVHVDSHGNITGADVCGVTISGAKFYENCWGLYGANINSWKYNGNGTWTFSTNGNGHGVGLSQYGAAAYIAKGQSWRWVLNHYYPGTTVA